MKKKVVFGVVSVLLILGIYSVYSRPMTLSQLYPMIIIDECTEIKGYYFDGTQTEFTEFTIERNSEEFQKLCSLFEQQKYRRSIRDILPRGGRTHQTQPGEYEFQWDVYFCFENVKLPDGNIGSGAMLNFQSWYGELDIYFDGEYYSCYTHQQKEWEREVLEVIKMTQ